MERAEFRTKLQKQIDFAFEEKDRDNVIDLRVWRAPYDAIKDYYLTDTDDIDGIYEFIKESEEWYVDIYENINGENRAEFTGFAVVSWN